MLDNQLSTRNVGALAWVVVLVAAVLSGLSLLARPPADLSDGEFYIPLVQSLFIAVVYFGVPYFFWSSLGKFKPELQRAYKVICVGIILLGVAQGQQAVLSIFGWWNSFWVV